MLFRLSYLRGCSTSLLRGRNPDPVARELELLVELPRRRLHLVQLEFGQRQWLRYSEHSLAHDVAEPDVRNPPTSNDQLGSLHGYAGSRGQCHGGDRDSVDADLDSR